MNGLPWEPGSDTGWCWAVGGEKQSDEMNCDRQGKETGPQTGGGGERRATAVVRSWRPRKERVMAGRGSCDKDDTRTLA